MEGSYADVYIYTIYTLISVDMEANETIDKTKQYNFT